LEGAVLPDCSMQHGHHGSSQLVSTGWTVGRTIIHRWENTIYE
jgi:hypothetical protein